MSPIMKSIRDILRNKGHPKVQPQTSSNFKSPIQQICQIPCLVFLQNCICNRSHFQCLLLTRCPSGRRRSAGPSRRGSGSTARTSTASRARKLAPGEFCNILDIRYQSLLLNHLLNAPEKGLLGSLSSFTTFGRRRSATMCLQTGTCRTMSIKSTMYSGCVLKMLFGTRY